MSPHLAQFCREHRDLLAADVVYTSDGPVHESGRYLDLAGRARRPDRRAGGARRRTATITPATAATCCRIRPGSLSTCWRRCARPTAAS